MSFSSEDSRLATVAAIMRTFVEASFRPRDLFAAIARGLADSLGDACAVLLLDAETRELRIAASTEHDRAREVGDVLKLDEHHALREVIATGTPLCTTVTSEQLESQTTRPFVEYAERVGLRSSLVVPLRGRDAVTGAIVLSRFGDHAVPYAREDLTLAMLLADHAAVAVDNARTYEALLEAQHEHEHFFATSPIPMYAFDTRTHEILAANDAALRLYGYSRAELLTARLEQLRAPDERPLEALLDDAGNAVLRNIARHRRKDGTLFEAEGQSHVATFRGREARFAVVTDRSELVAARRDRVRAESRFECLAESGVLGILVTDFDGRIREANDAVVEMLGYSRDELLDPEFRWSRLPSPEWQAEHRAKLARLRTEGVERPREREYVRKDGERLPVLTGAAVITGSDEIVSFVLDLRGQKWAQAAIDHLREARISEAKYQLANRELEAFSYSVAHDLRAPLRGMAGFARLLAETYAERLDADGRDWLDEIGRNAERMGGLIDALLSLSRISRGDLSVQQVDLRVLATEALRRLALDEPARSFELVAPEPVGAMMDLRLARTLVDNLVANAWKFTRPRTRTVISVGSAMHDGRRAYFVADNGVGFDMRYVSKLFAPFQRLHAEREFTGTGIGLATVQRIVHRHHGRVWAEAREGVGATFWFTLEEQQGT